MTPSQTQSITLAAVLFCLLGVAGGALAPASAVAQRWSGTTGLTVKSGYQTNPYLDAGLGVWDPTVAPVFGATTPFVASTYAGPQWTVRGVARMRGDARGGDVGLSLAQTAFDVRYEISPRWTMGGSTGYTGYRLQTARDVVWMIPSVRLSLADRSAVEVQAGATRQTLDAGASPQTSAVATVSGTTWLAERLRGTLRLYRTTGQVQGTTAEIGGSGAGLQLRYWPRTDLAVDLTSSAEWLTFDTDAARVRDRILKVGAEAEWSVRPGVEVFVQTGASTSTFRTGAGPTDGYVGGGVRLHVRRTLWESDAPALDDRLWALSETGVRFRVPYDGPGAVYVTGDFTGWSSPGIPLTKSGDETWTGTVDLTPGRYQYRIRIVTDAGSRWYDFPPYARTTSDAFGGTNGVCIVQ